MTRRNTPRRRLTVIRWLAVGILPAQSVNGDVLFIDREPAADKRCTKKLWIYDLRTNKHFSLKENPLKRR